jgi:outer membrane protein
LISGGRSGRIDQAKARLLAADFDFNDAHRRVIYLTETAYYLLLNAIGQEEAARANRQMRTMYNEQPNPP